MPSTGPHASCRRPAHLAVPLQEAFHGSLSIWLRTALAVVAVLAASVAVTGRSTAAIPEPTATAQAALLGACVDLAPLRTPITEPMRAVCAAVVLVYTDLLSANFRNHHLHRVYVP